MSLFLYIFGYNTPDQIEAFENYGYDDEDSESVFIEAKSEAEALAWGREISREFIRRFYGARGLVWDSADYANWIEAVPQRRFTSGVLARTPVVRVGEHPALDERLEQFAQRVSEQEASKEPGQSKTLN